MDLLLGVRGALAISLTSLLLSGASAHAFGPLPPANPAAGPVGTATMHGDTASSDSTPYSGPSGQVSARFQELGAACPTTLVGRDGMPFALCTSIATRAPSVILLDPSTALPLATLPLAGGSLFAGVYPYLDARGRVVVVDGNGDLLRVAHEQDALGRWQLRVDDRLALAPALTARCGDLCGGVVGLAPDWRGRVWFAAAHGVAGYADPRTGAIRTVRLGQGEGVANSISTVRGGTAVVTDHALYELSAAAGGTPRVRWRYAYDRGPARKPGQLSRGSGATPTYFGPRAGTEYLAITDNAAPHERLLILRRQVRRGQRRLVCRLPVLTNGVSGTENSPIGSGRSVFVASTYGYPYPAEPQDQPAAQPATAPFTGGLTRVDLRPGGRGCSTRWQIGVRSSAVPRLSLADGSVYTVERTSPSDPAATTPLDGYSLVAIDARTGAIRSRALLAAGAQA
ncbi:MAG: hypothetical protein QOC95_2184, partial [Thermoleophilaceae bacterium]|nr:hypothetical protein [Thermoleophilaceae bacterium]